MIRNHRPRRSQWRAGGRPRHRRILFASAFATGLIASTLLATAAPASASQAATVVRTAALEDPGAGPHDLTVGHLGDPVDVEDLKSPLLGWQVGAGMQSAYEVQVASTASGIADADVWDSGKVTSTQNANLAYAGPTLSRSAGYYWRVRTWDSTDTPSAWSDTAHFGTGPGATWPGATPIWTTAVPGLSVGDFTYSGTFNIAAVAASINFREKDTQNFYMWQFRTDGTLKEHTDVNGTFTVINTAPLPLTLTAGTNYNFKIVTAGSTISTFIKAGSSTTWLSAGSVTNSTFAAGAIGFRTGSTESFTVDDLNLTDSTGTLRYANDFSDASSAPFAACGSVANGVQNVAVSKNCGYFGNGSTSNNWAFMRGDVTLADQPVAWGHLYVAASSTAPARQFVAKTSLNGSVVGVGPSRPVGSETRYDGYDVTSLLRPGQRNTISALAYTTSDQRYQAQLVVRYDDGTTQTFSTGPAWKALNGSLVLPDAGSIGTSYYTAPKENFQASAYPFGYDEPGFDDTTWPAATLRSAYTNLVATPDAKVEDVLETPAKVVEYSPGNYFIDYGRTWIGGLSLDLTGTSGQKVDVRYGQVTSSANTVKYQTAAGNTYEDVWTLRKGTNKLETWGPRVFRYVNVLGAPTGLTAEDLKADAYVYPFDTSLNAFDSASDNLNQVWQLTKNTIESLNLNGYVDSYERERGFYEADDYIQMMSNLYTGGDSTLGTYSTLYLLANRTWPTEWPFYAILSLHDTYLATGDASTIGQYYSALQGKLPDQWYDATSGLIHKTSGANGCSSSTDCDIVDWPAGDRDGFVFTPYDTVINAISYRAYSDMADIATALGKTSDAATYRSRAATIKDGLNALMWDPAKGAYRDGSTDGTTATAHWAVQSTAFAIAMGVATPTMASAGAAYLGSRGMACSVYCADFMLQAAYDGNDPEVGTGFMTSEASHSWMAMIDQGAGATMEAWNPQDKSNLTYSHPWASGPASDIPQYMFGINPTSAGYDTFDVKPQATASVPWAHITVPSVKGTIGAAYDLTGDRTDVAALVPANSTASVSVPTDSASGAASEESVYVDGIATSAAYSDGFLTVSDVGPGCHVFTTDSSGSAYADSHLTAICGGTYQAQQRITFASIAEATFGDADITVHPTSTSGLPVALTTSGPCAVTDQSAIHLTGGGTCTVVASQAGDATYAAAQAVTRTFEIARAAQTISLSAIGSQALGDPDVTVDAAASSGLPVELSATGPCSVDGLTVHSLSVGTCTLVASQEGDADYLAAPSVTTSFAVTPARWSLTTRYAAGDRVTLGSTVWESLRPNTAKVPGDPEGPWQEMATTADGTAIWTPSRVFERADRAVYDGTVYLATRRTRNQPPGGPDHAWVQAP